MKSHALRDLRRKFQMTKQNPDGGPFILPLSYGVRLKAVEPRWVVLQDVGLG